MLSFYINTGPEQQARPPFSRLLTIKSCAEFTHDSLPPSHIYVSSSHYVDLLEQSQNRQSPAHSLKRLTEQDAAHIASKPDFPTSFRNLGFESVTQLHTHVKQHSKHPYQPTFALINGIGTGLGDNVVGIGVLQRLIKLLAPLRPQFCLLQELEERVEPLYRALYHTPYRDSPAVSVKPCFMPLNEFLRFDFYIDFSTIKDMPSFNDVAAAHFNAHAFSVNRLLPSSNIQATLTTDNTKTKALKTVIHQTLPANKPTVLLHPLASSKLRTLPSHKAAEMIQALGQSGYNVVSAFDHNAPPSHFLSLSEHSKTIDDLIHIIDAVDAVISVGTVVYHLASALGKPTVLLPTVQADIRSAKLMPEVLAWLPVANQGLHPNLHKSEEPKDLAVAEQIWRNVKSADVVTALNQHIDSLSRKNKTDNKTINKTPRVAVIIPHAPQTSLLSSCLDSLTAVQGFDPQALFTIENHGLGHSHHRYADAFNQGIEQALNLQYDYLWLLHDNARVPSNYLERLLAHFDNRPSLGIIGSNDHGMETLYNNLDIKPDYLALTKTDTGLREPWITFSSCLIRAEVFTKTERLDTTMQRLFCDADLCIRAAEQGWETWHDPTLSVEFAKQSQAEKADSPARQRAMLELKQSAKAFHAKWSQALGTRTPEDTEEALLRHVGF